MSKNPPHRINVSDSLLIAPSKSSRLQALREKQQSANSAIMPTDLAAQKFASQNFSPELLFARQVIDECLAEVMQRLPIGKQKSLFKLRYGIVYEEIRLLPLKQIINLLSIQHPQLNKLLSYNNRLAELNYNGD
jgi:hypothetical protein